MLHLDIKLLCPRGTQTCALAVANIGRLGVYGLFWAFPQCACAEAGIILPPVKNLTSPPFPATPISYKGVKCPLFREVKGVIWAFFTAHAHKRPYFYFRSKIWRHRRFRRPRFPIKALTFPQFGNYMSQNALSRNVNGNGKVSLDTHPESDQHQNQTLSRGSPPAPTHHIWSWSMNPFLRYRADKHSAHRHTDTQTDTRRWPQDLAAYVDYVS